VPGVDELKEQIELLDPPAETLTGLGLQPVTERPDGVTEVVRVTMPAKLLILVSVTVVEPVAPVLKSEGLVAEMLKFPTKVNCAVAWWDAVPGEPEPVMVTMKVPGDEDVQVNIEEPVAFAASVTLGEEKAPQLRPEGSGVSDNATLPAKF